MKNKYAVAAAHPLAMRAGEQMLAEGGNLYDAAIATSAALTVVQPHLNGLGSDLFALVDEGKPFSINASGYAAALADIDFFVKSGYTQIPDRGPLSSFMVPGMVSAWSIMAERATMPLRHLLEPAINYAEQGFRPSDALRNAAIRMRGADRDWNSIYGNMGDVLYQRDLAKTLRSICSDNGHSFYHGEIARAIERDMISKGGLLRFSDLDGYTATIESPLSTNYRGYTFYTNPPNSQGATALYWLRRLDGADMTDYYRALISSMYVAYRWRARRIADPRYLNFSETFLDEIYEETAPRKYVSQSDTTAFSVFDGENGMSVIQSNYKGFGSGHTVAGTGINLNDRGSYFTLDASHHNSLAPGKKTFHTLMTIFAKGPERIYLGTMGGDVQPQVNVQIICNVIDRGMGIQQAVDAPRFANPASIYSSSDLYAEEGLELSGAKSLRRYDSLFGHAHSIYVGSEVLKGIDPRGDGLINY
jgi:gamma-glutamyltranspeptidase